MPSELIQISLNSPITIVVAIALVILAVALLVVLLLRLRSSKRREMLARARQIEMEREAQFASAAGRIPHLRRPAEVASSISQLFSEQLSIRLLAVYAGRETDESLSNLLAENESGPDAASRFDLPDRAPSSLLQGREHPFVTSAVDLVNSLAEPAELRNERSDDSPGPSGVRAESVLLLPWRGPFDWSGLMVALPPEGITAEALNPFRDTLNRLTDKLSLALELEQNGAELEASEQRASRITSFSRSLIACLEEALPLAAIVKKVTELAGTDSAALWRIDEGASMLTMVAAHGLRSVEFLPLPLGKGLTGSVAQGGLIAVEDAPADPRCIFPREARESGINSYLGAPLVADGKTLGVIEVHSATRRSWTEGDRRTLESVAAIIAELMKSTDSRGNRLKVESAYLGLSEALQLLQTPDEVKEAVVEVLGHALGASRVLVVEIGVDGKPVPVKQEYRQPTAKSALGATFGEMLVARAQESVDGSIAIADSREDSLMGPAPAVELGVLSELAVPLRSSASVRAIVYIHQCDRIREWEEDEIEFAERVARQLRLSLANLEAREAVRAEAARFLTEARQMREEETRAELMLNGFPDFVVGLDREGRLSFLNAAARDRLGFTGDDLGKAIDLKRAIIANESVWETIAVCQKAVRFDGEARQQAANSSPVHVSICAAPLRDAKGEIIGRLIVASDVSHLKSEDPSPRIHELEQKLESLERVLLQSRDGEEQARGMLVKASALEAKARAEADVSRHAEAELRKQLDEFQEQHKQVQGSAQQLIEINRLKSEFIVNAGHEIEASLQSVLGLAELLERGSYGSLTPEQREAVHGLYGWARRIKSDVDWLIEYGSTRSRRLEPSSSG